MGIDTVIAALCRVWYLTEMSVNCFPAYIAACNNQNGGLVVMAPARRLGREKLKVLMNW